MGRGGKSSAYPQPHTAVLEQLATRRPAPCVTKGINPRLEVEGFQKMFMGEKEQDGLDYLTAMQYLKLREDARPPPPKGMEAFALAGAKISGHVDEVVVLQSQRLGEGHKPWMELHHTWEGELAKVVEEYWRGTGMWTEKKEAEWRAIPAEECLTILAKTNDSALPLRPMEKYLREQMDESRRRQGLPPMGEDGFVDTLAGLRSAPYALGQGLHLDLLNMGAGVVTYPVSGREIRRLMRWMVKRRPGALSLLKNQQVQLFAGHFEDISEETADARQGHMISSGVEAGGMGGNDLYPQPATRVCQPETVEDEMIMRYAVQKWQAALQEMGEMSLLQNMTPMRYMDTFLALHGDEEVKGIVGWYRRCLGIAIAGGEGEPHYACQQCQCTMLLSNDTFDV